MKLSTVRPGQPTMASRPSTCSRPPLRVRAPHDGFLEAVLPTGSAVRTGGVLGRVVSILPAPATPVVSPVHALVIEAAPAGPVHRFVHPDEFAAYREIGYELGLDYVESGPLVRSSYHSERHVTPGIGKGQWEAKQAMMTA